MSRCLLLLVAVMALPALAAPASAADLGGLGLPEAGEVLPPHTQCHLNLGGFCVIHPPLNLCAIVSFFVC